MTVAFVPALGRHGDILEPWKVIYKDGRAKAEPYHLEALIASSHQHPTDELLLSALPGCL